MRHYTKRQVLEMFHECHKGTLPKNDIPAKREAWSNFLDSVMEDGHVPREIGDRWTNPF